jgi:hypothetical protein
MIQGVLLANTILLPFAINPYGTWGPIKRNVLLPMAIDTHLTFPNSGPCITSGEASVKIKVKIGLSDNYEL